MGELTKCNGVSSDWKLLLSFLLKCKAAPAAISPPVRAKNKALRFFFMIAEFKS